MFSKKYPGSVVFVLAMAACSGWVFGLWKAGGNRDVAGGPGDGSADFSTKSSIRTAAREGKGAPAIADPVTARLLGELGSIEAAAVPGEVNDALLSACRNVLMDGNFRRRERNYGILLELMRPEDAAALHKMFLDFHGQGRTFGEYGAFATRWGEVDPVGALDYLTHEEPFRMPPRDFAAIARGWGVNEPQAALKWMDEHPEYADSMGGRAAVLEGWVRDDPKSALRWLDQNRSTLPPQELFNASRAAFLEQVQGPNAGLSSAVSWLASLPEEGISGAAARNAWASSQWCLGELSYETAADVWSQVGDRSWMTFHDFSNFSDAMGRARSADDGVEGFFDALEKTWPAESIEGRFAEWTAMDPVATSGWLAKAPDTPVTRAAISGLVRSLQETDPAAAKEWSERLENQ